MSQATQTSQNVVVDDEHQTTDHLQRNDDRQADPRQRDPVPLHLLDGVLEVRGLVGAGRNPDSAGQYSGDQIGDFD